MFYVHPDPWGNDPIWRAYFSDGLKPPASGVGDCWRMDGKMWVFNKLSDPGNSAIVTFLGWWKRDPWKGLSDLQIRDKKVTLNHLVNMFYYCLICISIITTHKPTKRLARTNPSRSQHVSIQPELGSLASKCRNPTGFRWVEIKWQPIHPRSLTVRPSKVTPNGKGKCRPCPPFFRGRLPLPTSGAFPVL